MAGFQTILCAADFSETSRQAFQVACNLASRGQTRLVVLHAEEPPVLCGELDFPLPTVGDRQAIRSDVERRLHETYAPALPLAAEYHSRDGFAAEEILLASHEAGADLIVMGTHGRTGLHRLLAGSTAEAVLRRARCPVLLVRSAAHLAATPATTSMAPSGSNESPGIEAPSGPGTGKHAPVALRTILCPTDFSDSSAAALPVARALAREHGGRLLVVHIAPLDEVCGVIPVLTSLADRKHTLDRIRQDLDDPEFACPVDSQLRLGEAASEILEVADEVGADLIVMGTHGRTGLARVLIGSVAESVLREASCPVLMIKAPVPASTCHRAAAILTEIPEPKPEVSKRIESM